MNNKYKVVFDENDPGYQKLLGGIRLASQDYLNCIDLSSVESFPESEEYKKKMQRIIEEQKRNEKRKSNS